MEKSRLPLFSKKSKTNSPKKSSSKQATSNSVSPAVREKQSPAASNVKPRRGSGGVSSSRGNTPTAATTAASPQHSGSSNSIAASTVKTSAAAGCGSNSSKAKQLLSNSGNTATTAVGLLGLNPADGGGTIIQQQQQQHHPQSNAVPQNEQGECFKSHRSDWYDENGEPILIVNQSTDGISDSNNKENVAVQSPRVVGWPTFTAPPPPPRSPMYSTRQDHNNPYQQQHHNQGNYAITTTNICNTLENHQQQHELTSGVQYNQSNNYNTNHMDVYVQNMEDAKMNVLSPTLLQQDLSPSCAISNVITNHQQESSQSQFRKYYEYDVTGKRVPSTTSGSDQDSSPHHDYEDIDLIMSAARASSSGAIHNKITTTGGAIHSNIITQEVLGDNVRNMDYNTADSIQQQAAVRNQSTLTSQGYYSPQNNTVSPAAAAQLSGGKRGPLPPLPTPPPPPHQQSPAMGSCSSASRLHSKTRNHNPYYVTSVAASKTYHDFSTTPTSSSHEINHSQSSPQNNIGGSPKYHSRLKNSDVYNNQRSMSLHQEVITVSRVRHSSSPCSSSPRGVSTFKQLPSSGSFNDTRDINNPDVNTKVIASPPSSSGIRNGSRHYQPLLSASGSLVVCGTPPIPNSDNNSSRERLRNISHSEERVSNIRRNSSSFSPSPNRGHGSNNSDIINTYSGNNSIITNHHSNNRCNISSNNTAAANSKAISSSSQDSGGSGHYSRNMAGIKKMGVGSISQHSHIDGGGVQRSHFLHESGHSSSDGGLDGYHTYESVNSDGSPTSGPYPPPPPPNQKPDPPAVRSYSQRMDHLTRMRNISNVAAFYKNYNTSNSETPPDSPLDIIIPPPDVQTYFHFPSTNTTTDTPQQQQNTTIKTNTIKNTSITPSSSKYGLSNSNNSIVVGSSEERSGNKKTGVNGNSKSSVLGDDGRGDRFSFSGINHNRNSSSDVDSNAASIQQNYCKRADLRSYDGVEGNTELTYNNGENNTQDYTHPNDSSSNLGYNTQQSPHYKAHHYTSKLTPQDFMVNNENQLMDNQDKTIYDRVADSNSVSGLDVNGGGNYNDGWDEGGRGNRYLYGSNGREKAQEEESSNSVIIGSGDKNHQWSNNIKSPPSGGPSYGYIYNMDKSSGVIKHRSDLKYYHPAVDDDDVYDNKDNVMGDNMRNMDSVYITKTDPDGRSVLSSPGSPPYTQMLPSHVSPRAITQGFYALYQTSSEIYNSCKSSPTVTAGAQQSPLFNRKHSFPSPSCGIRMAELRAKANRRWSDPKSPNTYGVVSSLDRTHTPSPTGSTSSLHSFQSVSVDDSSTASMTTITEEYDKATLCLRDKTPPRDPAAKQNRAAAISSYHRNKGSQASTDERQQSPNITMTTAGMQTTNSNLHEYTTTNSSEIHRNNSCSPQLSSSKSTDDKCSKTNEIMYAATSYNDNAQIKQHKTSSANLQCTSVEGKNTSSELINRQGSSSKSYSSCSVSETVNHQQSVDDNLLGAKNNVKLSAQLSDYNKHQQQQQQSIRFVDSNLSKQVEKQLLVVENTTYSNDDDEKGMNYNQEESCELLGSSSSKNNNSKVSVVENEVKYQVVEAGEELLSSKANEDSGLFNNKCDCVQNTDRVSGSSVKEVSGSSVYKGCIEMEGEECCVKECEPPEKNTALICRSSHSNEIIKESVCVCIENNSLKRDYSSMGFCSKCNNRHSNCVIVHHSKQQQKKSGGQCSGDNGVAECISPEVEVQSRTIGTSYHENSGNCDINHSEGSSCSCCCDGGDDGSDYHVYDNNITAIVSNFTTNLRNNSSEYGGTEVGDSGPIVPNSSEDGGMEFQQGCEYISDNSHVILAAGKTINSVSTSTSMDGDGFIIENEEIDCVDGLFEIKESNSVLSEDVFQQYHTHNVVDDDDTKKSAYLNVKSDNASQECSYVEKDSKEDRVSNACVQYQVGQKSGLNNTKGMKGISKLKPPSSGVVMNNKERNVVKSGEKSALRSPSKEVIGKKGGNSPNVNKSKEEVQGNKLSDKGKVNSIKASKLKPPGQGLKSKGSPVRSSYAVRTEKSPVDTTRSKTGNQARSTHVEKTTRNQVNTKSKSSSAVKKQEEKTNNGSKSPDLVKTPDSLKSGHHRGRMRSRVGSYSSLSSCDPMSSLPSSRCSSRLSVDSISSDTFEYDFPPNSSEIERESRSASSPPTVIENNGGEKILEDSGDVRFNQCVPSDLDDTSFCSDDIYIGNNDKSSVTYNSVADLSRDSVETTSSAIHTANSDSINSVEDISTILPEDSPVLAKHSPVLTDENVVSVKSSQIKSPTMSSLPVPSKSCDTSHNATSSQSDDITCSTPTSPMSPTSPEVFVKTRRSMLPSSTSSESNMSGSSSNHSCSNSCTIEALSQQNAGDSSSSTSGRSISKSRSSESNMSNSSANSCTIDASPHSDKSSNAAAAAAVGMVPVNKSSSKVPMKQQPKPQSATTKGSRLRKPSVNVAKKSPTQQAAGKSKLPQAAVSTKMNASMTSSSSLSSMSSSLTGKTLGSSSNNTTTAAFNSKQSATKNTSNISKTAVIKKVNVKDTTGVNHKRMLYKSSFSRSNSSESNCSSRSGKRSTDLSPSSPRGEVKHRGDMSPSSPRGEVNLNPSSPRTEGRNSAMCSSSSSGSFKQILKPGESGGNNTSKLRAPQSVSKLQKPRVVGNKDGQQGSKIGKLSSPGFTQQQQQQKKHQQQASGSNKNKAVTDKNHKRSSSKNNEVIIINAVNNKNVGFGVNDIKAASPQDLKVIQGLDESKIVAGGGCSDGNITRQKVTPVADITMKPSNTHGGDSNYKTNPACSNNEVNNEGNNTECLNPDDDDDSSKKGESKSTGTHPPVVITKSSSGTPAEIKEAITAQTSPPLLLPNKGNNVSKFIPAGSFTAGNARDKDIVKNPPEINSEDKVSATNRVAGYLRDYSGQNDVKMTKSKNLSCSTSKSGVVIDGGFNEEEEAGKFDSSNRSADIKQEERKKKKHKIFSDKGSKVAVNIPCELEKNATVQDHDCSDKNVRMENSEEKVLECFCDDDNDLEMMHSVHKQCPKMSNDNKATDSSTTNTILNSSYTENENNSRGILNNTTTSSNHDDKLAGNSRDLSGNTSNSSHWGDCSAVLGNDDKRSKVFNKNSATSDHDQDILIGGSEDSKAADIEINKLNKARDRGGDKSRGLIGRSQFNDDYRVVRTDGNEASLCDQVIAGNDGNKMQSIQVINGDDISDRSEFGGKKLGNFDVISGAPPGDCIGIKEVGNGLAEKVNMREIEECSQNEAPLSDSRHGISQQSVCKSPAVNYPVLVKPYSSLRRNQSPGGSLGHVHGNVIRNGKGGGNDLQGQTLNETNNHPIKIGSLDRTSSSDRNMAHLSSKTQYLDVDNDGSSVLNDNKKSAMICNKAGGENERSSHIDTEGIYLAKKNCVHSGSKMEGVIRSSRLVDLSPVRPQGFGSSTGDGVAADRHEDRHNSHSASLNNKHRGRYEEEEEAVMKRMTTTTENICHCDGFNSNNQINHHERCVNCDSQNEVILHGNGRNMNICRSSKSTCYSPNGTKQENFMSTHHIRNNTQDNIDSLKNNEEIEIDRELAPVCQYHGAIGSDLPSPRKTDNCLDTERVNNSSSDQLPGVRSLERHSETSIFPGENTQVAKRPLCGCQQVSLQTAGSSLRFEKPQSVVVLPPQPKQINEETSGLRAGVIACDSNGVFEGEIVASEEPVVNNSTSNIAGFINRGGSEMKNGVDTRECHDLEAVVGSMRNGAADGKVFVKICEHTSDNYQRLGGADVRNEVENSSDDFNATAAPVCRHSGNSFDKKNKKSDCKKCNSCHRNTQGIYSVATEDRGNVSLTQSSIMGNGDVTQSGMMGNRCMCGRRVNEEPSSNDNQAGINVRLIGGEEPRNGGNCGSLNGSRAETVRLGGCDCCRDVRVDREGNTDHIITQSNQSGNGFKTKEKICHLWGDCKGDREIRKLQCDDKSTEIGDYQICGRCSGEVIKKGAAAVYDVCELGFKSENFIATSTMNKKQCCHVVHTEKDKACSCECNNTNSGHENSLRRQVNGVNKEKEEIEKHTETLDSEFGMSSIERNNIGQNKGTTNRINTQQQQQQNPATVDSDKSECIDKMELLNATKCNNPDSSGTNNTSNNTAVIGVLEIDKVIGSDRSMCGGKKQDSVTVRKDGSTEALPSLIQPGDISQGLGVVGYNGRNFIPPVGVQYDSYFVLSDNRGGDNPERYMTFPAENPFVSPKRRRVGLQKKDEGRKEPFEFNLKDQYIEDSYFGDTLFTSLESPSSGTGKGLGNTAASVVAMGNGELMLNSLKLSESGYDSWKSQGSSSTTCEPDDDLLISNSENVVATKGGLFLKQNSNVVCQHVSSTDENSSSSDSESINGTSTASVITTKTIREFCNTSTNSELENGSVCSITSEDGRGSSVNNIGSGSCNSSVNNIGGSCTSMMTANSYECCSSVNNSGNSTSSVDNIGASSRHCCSSVSNTRHSDWSAVNNYIDKRNSMSPVKTNCHSKDINITTKIGSSCLNTKAIAKSKNIKQTSSIISRSSSETTLNCYDKYLEWDTSYDANNLLLKTDSRSSMEDLLQESAEIFRLKNNHGGSVEKLLQDFCSDRDDVATNSDYIYDSGSLMKKRLNFSGSDFALALNSISKSPSEENVLGVGVERLDNQQVLQQHILQWQQQQQGRNNSHINSEVSELAADRSNNTRQQMIDTSTYSVDLHRSYTVDSNDCDNAAATSRNMGGPLRNGGGEDRITTTKEKVLEGNVDIAGDGSSIYDPHENVSKTCRCHDIDRSSCSGSINRNNTCVKADDSSTSGHCTGDVMSEKAAFSVKDCRRGGCENDIGDENVDRMIRGCRNNCIENEQYSSIGNNIDNIQNIPHKIDVTKHCYCYNNKDSISSHENRSRLDSEPTVRKTSNFVNASSNNHNHYLCSCCNRSVNYDKGKESNVIPSQEEEGGVLEAKCNDNSCNDSMMLSGEKISSADHEYVCVDSQRQCRMQYMMCECGNIGNKVIDSAEIRMCDNLSVTCNQQEVSTGICDNCGSYSETQGDRILDNERIERLSVMQENELDCNRFRVEVESPLKDNSQVISNDHKSYSFQENETDENGCKNDNYDGRNSSSNKEIIVIENIPPIREENGGGNCFRVTSPLGRSDQDEVDMTGQSIVGNSISSRVIVSNGSRIQPSGVLSKPRPSFLPKFNQGKQEQESESQNQESVLVKGEPVSPSSQNQDSALLKREPASPVKTKAAFFEAGISFLNDRRKQMFQKRSFGGNATKGAAYVNNKKPLGGDFVRGVRSEIGDIMNPGCKVSDDYNTNMAENPENSVSIERKDTAFNENHHLRIDSSTNGVNRIKEGLVTSHQAISNEEKKSPYGTSSNATSSSNSNSAVNGNQRFTASLLNYRDKVLKSKAQKQEESSSRKMPVSLSVNQQQQQQQRNEGCDGIIIKGCYSERGANSKNTKQEFLLSSETAVAMEVIEPMDDLNYCDDSIDDVNCDCYSESTNPGIDSFISERSNSFYSRPDSLRLHSRNTSSGSQDVTIATSMMVGSNSRQDVEIQNYEEEVFSEDHNENQNSHYYNSENVYGSVVRSLSHEEYLKSRRSRGTTGPGTTTTTEHQPEFQQNGTLILGSVKTRRSRGESETSSVYKKEPPPVPPRSSSTSISPVGTKSNRLEPDDTALYRRPTEPVYATSYKQLVSSPVRNRSYTIPGEDSMAENNRREPFGTSGDSTNGKREENRKSSPVYSEPATKQQSSNIPKLTSEPDESQEIGGKFSPSLIPWGQKRGHNNKSRVMEKLKLFQGDTQGQTSSSKVKGSKSASEGQTEKQGSSRFGWNFKLRKTKN